MRQLLLTGLVLVVLFPMPGIAQVSAPDPFQKRLNAIARLKPGKLIRVHAQSLGEIVGRYYSSTDDSLFISDAMGKKGKSSLPIAAIDAIWVRGRATWKGAKIGGIVVGGLGTLIGIAVAVDCADQGLFGGGPEPCPWVIPLLGAGGAIAGGLVGAGWGTAFPKWHQRYRSPDYDRDAYSNLSEAEYAAYWDGGVEYSNENLKAVHPNRLRFSIVPDISRGGVNISASFVF